MLLLSKFSLFLEDESARARMAASEEERPRKLCLIRRELIDRRRFAVDVDIVASDERREEVAAALAVLQSDHAAQVNLLSILGGARFKYAIHGVLVPTRCPNKKYGRQCNREDSYEHLLRCYALSTEERPGIAAVDFLVTLAKRTKTRQPGVPTPMYGI